MFLFTKMKKKYIGLFNQIQFTEHFYGIITSNIHILNLKK